jgi:hypothetical protein
MVFFYEKPILNMENKRTALKIDEELKVLFNEKEAASLNVPLDTLYKHYGKTSGNFNAGLVIKRASDIVGVNRGAKLYKLYASLKRYERDLTTPRKIATPVLPVSAAGTAPAVGTVPTVTPTVNSVWSGKIPATINKSS